MTLNQRIAVLQREIEFLEDFLKIDPNDFMLRFNLDDLSCRLRLLERVKDKGWDIIDGAKQMTKSWSSVPPKDPLNNA